MEAKRLEVVPGIGAPWCVRDAAFDATARTLAVAVDFAAGSRLGHPEGIGEHADHDTAVKRDRHLNVFPYECVLEMRAPV